MATTIQVDAQTKEKLRSFGQKGDTYQDIINRLYDIAVQQQLHEFLFAPKAIPIKEALEEAKKKYGHS